jgi:glycosyltransferase involved in cell wall biosynthesis
VMKKVVMLLDNPYLPDYRVKAEIDFLLSKEYSIDLYCTISNSLGDHEEKDQLNVFRKIEAISRPFSNEYKTSEQRLVDELTNATFDILHCHDWRTVIIGVKIKEARKKAGKTTKLIYDSHEYLKGYPYYENIKGLVNRTKGKVVWKWYVKEEKKAMAEVDGVITVSNSICEALKQDNKLATKPTLVRNIPLAFEIAPAAEKPFFYRHFHIPEDAKLIVHTGNIYYEKKRLKALFEVIAQHENWYVVFIGVGHKTNEQKRYLEEEVGMGRALFYPFIPREKVTYYCSTADMGLVFTWKKKWRSHWFSSPNKMFDTALAGLPLLCTAQPEFENLVKTYGHGESFDGDSKASLENAFQKLISNYDSYKAKAEKIKEDISWDKEAVKIIDLYNSVTP